VSGVVSSITRPRTPPASPNVSSLLTPTATAPHRTHTPQVIVHPDDAPQPCHALTLDKNPNRNARAGISSNPGLCRGFARHESFIR